MPSSQLEPGNNFFCSVCPPHVFDGKALGTGFEERRFATLWYTWYAQATTQVFNLLLFISVRYIFRYRLANRRGARGQYTLMYLARQSSACSVRLVALRLWENDQQKWATCFAELHKIELKSHVARFIPPGVKPVFQQIRLLQVAIKLWNSRNFIATCDHRCRQPAYFEKET